MRFYSGTDRLRFRTPVNESYVQGVMDRGRVERFFGAPLFDEINGLLGDDKMVVSISDSVYIPNYLVILILLILLVSKFPVFLYEI